jgi:predicted nucleic acid-binding protein
MPLDLPDGASCFLDSNILYYALVPTAGVSEHCLNLIDRAIAGKVSASVSIPVLSDAIHKVMISEVAQLAGRDRVGIVGFLGKHPEFISRLVEYPQAIERLGMVPMQILPLDNQLLRDATRLAVQYGILTNDALIAALMQRHGIIHLVTNDDDFDRVAGLTVWKPR